jgi:hypothetical protein
MRDASAVGSLGIDIRRRCVKGVLRYRPGLQSDHERHQTKEDRYAEGGAAVFQASGSRAWSS